MPKEIFELDPLFNDVQMSRIFEDGKTFVDCISKSSADAILQQYLQQKNTPGFDLKKFVLSNFDLPKITSASYQTIAGTSVAAHIHNLWPVLTKQPEEKTGSLISLPYPYIVPGGRFGEIYYWDSYFTMLGLKASGMTEMIENMVNNFSHLILTQGYIPNGNRTYYLGRSQPPFYSLMVQLLAGIKGKNILIDYIKPLETEYNFWMKGSNMLDENNAIVSVSTNHNAGNAVRVSTNHNAASHTIQMKNGELLNRYWDEHVTPRPESYREDVELSHQADQPPENLFRHLRAGAESGWDYSSRWFSDGESFNSIHTSDIVPVDLNSLLYHLEHTLAEAHELQNNDAAYRDYSLLAEKRKAAIQKYCWNEEAGFYFDHDLESSKQSSERTLAGIVPLYVGIATQTQADLAAEILQSQFLKNGGLVTTLKETGQQWDAPNGWAPLQWMAIKGLKSYGHNSLAATIAERWIKLNTDVFNRTGKMMEKYNVVNTELEAGGGEYTGQDGFGWTNGVYLALNELYNK